MWARGTPSWTTEASFSWNSDGIPNLETAVFLETTAIFMELTELDILVFSFNNLITEMRKQAFNEERMTLNSF